MKTRISVRSLYLSTSEFRDILALFLSAGYQTDVTNHVFEPTICKSKNSTFCRRNKSTSLALRMSLAPSALTQPPCGCGKSKSTCVFFGNPPRGLTKMKPYPGCHFFLFSKKGRKKKEEERNNNNKMITRKEDIRYTSFSIIYFIISLQINIFVLVACLLERIGIVECALWVLNHPEQSNSLLNNKKTNRWNEKALWAITVRLPYFHPQYSPRNGPWECLAWTQRTLGRVNEKNETPRTFGSISVQRAPISGFGL